MRIRYNIRASIQRTGVIFRIMELYLSEVTDALVIFQVINRSDLSLVCFMFLVNGIELLQSFGFKDSEIIILYAYRWQ